MLSDVLGVLLGIRVFEEKLNHEEIKLQKYAAMLGGAKKYPAAPVQSDIRASLISAGVPSLKPSQSK